MRVEYIEEGHQLFWSGIGELLQYTTKCEVFGEGKNKVFIQVAAVIIKIDNNIKLLPLNKYLRTIELKVIEE